ncbi:MAG TPA: DUF5715 family protein [Longimicrobiaceae bacterium]
MNRLLVSLTALAGLLAHAVFPASLLAQSLRGSTDSIDRMYVHAVENGIYFYKTGDGIRRAGKEGRFVRLSGNANYTTSGVSYPYARPETRVFVERLAAQFRSACGERLVVTSAARPKSMRLFNSVRKSVHPTGMAIDLRKPRKRSCLSWLRRTLLTLEERGVIEATEEHHPPHFHVAVYPAPYARYVAARGGPRLASGTEYRVRRGDSLWGIARRHDTTVDALMAANDLNSSRILPGQTLTIP